MQIYGDSPAQLQHAGRLAQGEARRIEEKYSRYRADSLLSRINAAAGSGEWIPLDSETQALLDYAQTAWEQSDGLFDITSGVLRRAWDFRQARLPSQQQLEALLPLIGWPQVERRSGSLRLPRAGMELDFGGFGKEYAADRAAAILGESGLCHGLVEFGGDIVVTGPHPDRKPWQLGIRNPLFPQQAVARIAVDRGALASSGDYERSFVHQGRRYSHILDPRSGWPVQGLSAVSVMAPQCLIAGTATTIALLKGNDGVRWLRELGLPWLAIDGAGGLQGSIAVDQPG